MKGPIISLFNFMSGNLPLELLVLSFFAAFVVIFLCFPIHESAHAFVAHWLGDDTASDMGRLTLNPLVHIDLLGALCVLTCNLGWAKPVPVTLQRCRKVSIRTADILVSAAGPVSNILMALIFMIIYKIIVVTATDFSPTWSYIVIGLDMVVSINAYLAVLNLIPIPPFDGYSLISGILPRKTAIWVEERELILNFVILVLLVSGALHKPIEFVADKILWVLDKMTFFIR